MGDKNKFLDDLTTFVKIAKTNHNRTTKQEIRDYFAELNLEEGQRAMIYRYVTDQGVFIEDYELWDEPISEEEFREEDQVESAIVKIYMEELKGKNELSPDQEQFVARKMLDGDMEARNLLIESNLTLVTKIAKVYKSKSLPMGDLIQEGNIGLLMGVNEYELSSGITFHEFISEAIHKAIEDALVEDSRETISAKKVASRANELSELATEMAKELEREATPSELAERMGITEDQVRQIMKISLDAVTVEEPTRS
jgi:RNA polymerase primary sigma factor